MTQLFRLVAPLVELLLRAGATRVLLVGGAVIDLLRGGRAKDLDIEVYGIPYASMVEALTAEGWPANLVGQSFGILKTVLPTGEDVDLSVPRRENKSGVGHKDFEVQTDPDMTPHQAARRRDLTINALALDLVSGAVLNLFGGLSDLHRGLIRVVDPETFVEDPLRVLRIMQLLPRKGKRVDRLTYQVCRLILPEGRHLPGERVFEEFRKLLLLASKPAKGLRFLERSGWIAWFPELDALRRVPQNPLHHPEGSVWNHTLLVVNEAAKLRGVVPDEWRLPLMFAALLHDVGKAATTDPETGRAYGHDEAGVPLARAFMARLRAPKELTDRVCALVRLHMRPGQLLQAASSEAAWRRLAKEIPLEILAALAEADSKGRAGHHRRPAPEADLARQMAARFANEPDAPLIRGRDLLQLGVKPGPKLGQALKAALEAQLEGIFDRGQLLQIALGALL